MANEPAGEKVLPASPRKLQQAREKGNIARSADLNSGLLLLVAGFALYVLGPFAFHRLLIATQYYFSDLFALTATKADMQPMLAQALWLAAPVVLPIMLTLMVAGIVINISQFGFLFSGQALQPKAERINPMKGLQRMFSLRALVELIKSLSKLTIIGYIVYLAVRGRVPEILALMHTSPWGVATGTWDLVWTVWWRVGLGMLVLGLMDFGYQRWQYLQDQRMTRQEAQDELKQLEGDPRIRQRVRQIQRQVAQQRMMTEVPEADVVVTNPTTFAVALRYDAAAADAPRVVAKGARLIAERIRAVAEESSVPIVERPELARSLFREIDLGEVVPEHLFRAVAEVLAYVYQIDRRAAKVAERRRTA